MTNRPRRRALVAVTAALSLAGVDVELGLDGRLYVATHGQGIWRIDSPGATG